MIKYINTDSDHTYIYIIISIHNIKNGYIISKDNKKKMKKKREMKKLLTLKCDK